MKYKNILLVFLQTFVFIFSKATSNSPHQTTHTTISSTHFTPHSSHKQGSYLTAPHLPHQDPSKLTLNPPQISLPSNNVIHRTLSSKTNGSSLTGHQGPNQVSAPTSNHLNGSPLTNSNNMKSSIPTPPPIKTGMVSGDLRTESLKPKVKEVKKKEKEGYFTKTSRQNRKAGAGVVGAFVSGWILFFVSICFICWNERKSVKDTEALDYLTDVCHDGSNGTLSTDPKNKNFNLFWGTAQVEKPAEIANLPLFNNKTVYITATIQKFMGNELIIKENEDGEETDRQEKEMWKYESELEKILPSTYKGEVIVKENNIKFDTKLLMYMTKNYTFQYDKRAIFEGYVKSQGWKYSQDEYCVVEKDEYMYILKKKEGTTSDELIGKCLSKDESFNVDDLRIKFNYVEFEENQKITLLGQVIENKENKDLKQLVSFNTGIREAGFCCICCCGDSESEYTYEQIWLDHKSKKDVIKLFESTNSACRWCLRICGFLLHFMAYYLILYPLIFLIGMIPYVGAVGATILILFAFIFAAITFLFLIACAWIVARPILAFVMFLIIFGLMFFGKNSRDKYSPDYNPNDPYGNNQYNQQGRPQQGQYNQQGRPQQGYQQQNSFNNGKARFL